MSQLSGVLDSLIKEIKTRISSTDILHADHAELLNEIAGECSFFVMIVSIPSLNRYFLCKPALEYLGLNAKDYQKLGNQFFYKVMHPDDFSAIQRGLQHFHTTPDEELLMACRFKTGKLGWRWIYGANRLLCMDENSDKCEVISVFCDVEALLQDNLFMPKKHHIQSLSAADKRRYTTLTGREKEVLSLIAQEFSNGKIARKLHISELTVKTHRKHLLKKLGAKNSIGLVRIAILLEPG